MVPSPYRLTASLLLQQQKFPAPSLSAIRLQPFSSSLYDYDPNAGLSPAATADHPELGLHQRHHHQQQQQEATSLLPCLRPSNDADLVYQILLQHHNPFHTMESSLQLNGIILTHHLVHQTLIRLKNVSKVALAFFTWGPQHHPLYRHDASAYHLIIDILAKVRQFDVVWQLILQMEPNPTSTAFLILIRRLVSAGLTRQALRAFHDMECFIQRLPDYHHFCYLLDTLCKYGHVKFAMEVFNQTKFRFEPDVKLYTILIYGWVNINRPQMGEKLLREMVEKRGIEPNVVTYNVLLNGICRRSSLHPEERFERTIREAEKLLDEMYERGIEPDVTSYSILLHAYSRSHKPELSLVKLRMMKSKGICPTVATYTSVVKCLCSCGRLEDAEKLLNEMVHNGVSPSAVTYNCFFKEYRGRKDADSALKLYRKMKTESLHLPSSNTYNVLVAMFVKLERMEIVKEIWDDMKAAGGVGPDLDAYTLLIHELCNKRKWKEACQYFVEMIERGLLPQTVTFETLYTGLIQANMLRTWRRLKKRLEEESLTFGSEFEHYHLKAYRR